MTRFICTIGMSGDRLYCLSLVCIQLLFTPIMRPSRWAETLSLMLPPLMQVQIHINVDEDSTVPTGASGPLTLVQPSSAAKQVDTRQWSSYDTTLAHGSHEQSNHVPEAIAVTYLDVPITVIEPGYAPYSKGEPAVSGAIFATPPMSPLMSPSSIPSGPTTTNYESYREGVRSEQRHLPTPSTDIQTLQMTKYQPTTQQESNTHSTSAKVDVKVVDMSEGVAEEQESRLLIPSSQSHARRSEAHDIRSTTPGARTS